MLAGHNCFNIDGYLKFTANKLKLLLQRLLQDEYHRAEQELEQEEFIELLRFFISIQPSVLDYAYLTIYHDRFTLTDAWGNDLRQIYLDSLLEEEIDDVSDNDLIMSILITLLPREIYLDVQGKPPSAEFCCYCSVFLVSRSFGNKQRINDLSILLYGCVGWARCCTAVLAFVQEKSFLSTIPIVLSCIVDFSDCNAYNKINFNFERKEGKWFGMAGGFDLCLPVIIYCRCD